MYIFKTFSQKAGKCFSIFLLLTVSFVPALLSAQGAPFDKYKVKKVSKSDFSLDNDVIDEYSKAVYLFDLGESKIEFSSKGIELEFTRHFRLQILSEQGISLADQIVELFMNNNIEESIGRVKGGVYNLQDGKVSFEKFENSDWATSTYDEHHKVARVKFRNVKVGSIIELRYTVFSPFVFHMPDWQFQYDEIPVLYSEYFIRYPDELGYKIFKSGSQPFIGDYHTVQLTSRMDKGVSLDDYRYDLISATHSSYVEITEN